MRDIVLALAFLAAATLRAGEETEFSTTKAKEAQKTYRKTAEKLRTEYEAKLRKARDDYAKALEAALKDAKKAKKSDEADRIEKALAELKKEGGEVTAKKAPKAPEKGPGGITYEGGSGESLEDAIVIKGAKDSPEGVDAEYRWVKVHYPNHKVGGQALRSEGGKKYDVLQISGPGGEKEIFFDITEFFGKF